MSPILQVTEPTGDTQITSKGGGVEKVVVMLTGMDMVSGMKWLTVQSLQMCLKPGDSLILLPLLHHIHFNPRPFISWHATAKLLGYKDRDDPNKVFGSNKKILEDELRKRKEEYRKNAALVQLQRFYEIEKKVNVSVEVEAGSSRKMAAVRAAKRLGATWIILDREMKKEKQYFLDRLSCRISSMKSNNSVVEIRGPIIGHVSYDEMIPSYSWEDLSTSPQTQKSPEGQGIKSASSSNFMETKSFQSHIQNSENNGAGKQMIARTASVFNSFRSPQNYENEEACKTVKINPSLQEILNLGVRERKQIKRVQMEEEFSNSICSICKNRRPKIGLQRDFTYGELREATDGFSKKNFLSEGGFGFVFKGTLKDEVKIAVKQHKPASLQGEKEFKSEVHLLSQARHQNLVMLLGSCTEGRHRLLVYEYVCNGSLDDHLSDECPVPLNWEKRIKIALGAAKGLEYLHARNIVHRDMRPGNILITHDHESLLGDFGLAKEHKDGSAHSSDKGVVGTLGYVAPEYAESGKMSTKTDVYSFGVVLLQLITGLRTTDEIPGGKSLVGWAKPLLESRNYPDLIDRRIVDSFCLHQLFWMVRVVEDCLKKDPGKRCTMKLVVHNLSCIKEGKTDLIKDF